MYIFYNSMCPVSAVCMHTGMGLSTSVTTPPPEGNASFIPEAPLIGVGSPDLFLISVRILRGLIKCKFRRCLLVTLPSPSHTRSPTHKAVLLWLEHCLTLESSLLFLSEVPVSLAIAKLFSYSSRVLIFVCFETESHYATSADLELAT